MGIFNFNVRPLCSYYRKVLPAVYDDSLSYYEQLCRIKYKLNEVIKNLNDLEENLPSYVKQAIDEALGGWEERMEAQFAEQNARIAAAEKKIDDSVNNMSDDVIQDIFTAPEIVNFNMNRTFQHDSYSGNRFTGTKDHFPFGKRPDLSGETMQNRRNFLRFHTIKQGDFF